MSQAELFSEGSSLPSGLVHQPAFLDSAEERDLLAGIATLELREAAYKEYTAKRRVASFGAGYDFDANELTPAPVIAPLKDEARWGWQHSIAPTPALRYSITFRTRRKA